MKKYYKIFLYFSILSNCFLAFGPILNIYTDFLNLFFTPNKTFSLSWLIFKETLQENLLIGIVYMLTLYFLNKLLEQLREEEKLVGDLAQLLSQIEQNNRLLKDKEFLETVLGKDKTWEFEKQTNQMEEKLKRLIKIHNKFNKDIDNLKN